MKSCGPSSLSPSSVLPFGESPPLPPSFYLSRPAEAAISLLGKGLFVNGMLVEITETEAYLGSEDPASHAFRGPTPRNRVRFEDGGLCYVYLSYGTHFCMNVVTGPGGSGEAVLLRSARPILGVAEMRKNRKGKDSLAEEGLLSGPGKLTQALAVDMSYNGVRFDRDDFKLIDLGYTLPDDAVSRSPRIGISKAREELLRFTISGSTWLSRKR